MPEFIPESRISQGWVVQRFEGATIRKFGVKIVEDIVRCAPLCHCRYCTLVREQYVNWNRASVKERRVAIVCSAMSMGSTVTESMNGVTNQ